MVPDLSPAEPFAHVEELVELVVDVDAWEEQVRAAAGVLDEFPSLQDWRVTFSSVGANKRYLNSEGSSHLKGATANDIEVAATAQAEEASG